MGNTLCSNFTSKQKQLIKEHKLLYKTLGFSRSDKNILAKAFFGADVDYSRKVSFREFTDRFGLSHNRFCKSAFMLFDRDHDGELNFTEFILCIWNFCTMTEADLIVAAYDCYNDDGHDGIHIDTMMKLVDEAMGVLSGFNVESGTKEMGFATGYRRHGYNPILLQKKELRALTKIANDEDRINEAGFKKYIRNHPILLKKVLIFKQELIDGVLGNHRWEHIAAKRSDVTKTHSGQHLKISRLIEILERKCKVDFGGVKRLRSVPLSDRVKDGPPKDKKSGKLYKIYEAQSKVAKAYENKTKSHHHDAATQIQKHIRRKLTAKRQKDGKLFQHKVAIGNNWYEKIDPGTQKVYYFNSRTRKTQWNKPEESIHRDHEEKHWKEFVDKKTGKVYYYNPDTQCTSWKKPY